MYRNQHYHHHHFYSRRTSFFFFFFLMLVAGAFAVFSIYFSLFFWCVAWESLDIYFNSFFFIYFLFALHFFFLFPAIFLHSLRAFIVARRWVETWNQFFVFIFCFNSVSLPLPWFATSVRWAANISFGTFRISVDCVCHKFHAEWHLVASSVLSSAAIVSLHARAFVWILFSALFIRQIRYIES